MPPKLTRRRLATLAATPLLSANRPDSAAAAQAPDAADDDLSIQRANLKRWREQIAQVKLAREVEPAATFKA